MPYHRDFSAWITSGDRYLPEYLVATDSSTDIHRVECWVPGEVGDVITPPPLDTLLIRLLDLHSLVEGPWHRSRLLCLHMA